MANEVTASVRFTATKDGVTVQVASSKRYDMSGVHFNDPVLDLTTTEEEVAKADIGTVGFVVLQPLTSNTDFISVGIKPAATFYEVMKLYPGMPPFLFFAGANALYAKANSGTQRLRAAQVES